MNLGTCSVPTCNNAVADNPNLQFHSLPGTRMVNLNDGSQRACSYRRSMWLEKMKLPDLGFDVPRVVCSQHFTESDYFTRTNFRAFPQSGGCVPQLMLKPSAVPSVNLPPDDYVYSGQDLMIGQDMEQEFDSLINTTGAEVLKDMVLKIRNFHLHRMYDMLFGDTKEEWIRVKPTLGGFVYTCYACRHLFSSFNVLQDHLNVRILLLKLKCEGCRDRCYTFYNPCVLLLHLRSHFTSDSSSINLNDIKTDILPLKLAGFFPIPDVPVLYEKEEDMLTDDTYVNVQFYFPKEYQRGQNVVEVMGDIVIFVENGKELTLRQVCKNVPKCQFVTIEEHNKLRENHIEINGVGFEPVIKDEPLDYDDQFTLPVITKVETVLEEESNSSMCLDCNLIQHEQIIDRHYQGSHKPNFNLTCEVCSFVAPTKCSFQAHCRLHTKTAPHVCPECGKHFDDSDVLHKHFEDSCFHLNKHVKFSCPAPRCSKIFATSKNFIAHFRNHIYPVRSCTSHQVRCKSNQDVIDHLKMHNWTCVTMNLYECEVCRGQKLFRESELAAHSKFHNEEESCYVYVYSCGSCRKNFKSSYTYEVHVLRCSGRKSRSVSERQHLRKFVCVLCKRSLTKDEQVDHITSCKYANPVVEVYKLGESYITAMTACYNSFTRPSKPNDLSDISKKRRKRYLTDISKRRRPEIRPDLIAEKPIEFDGTYHCQLCGYSGADRSDFHTHVRKHRDSSAPYQCMECGECFVVKTTLFKHLRHYHNISDHESYLKDNDCVDK